MIILWWYNIYTSYLFIHLLFYTCTHQTYKSVAEEIYSKIALKISAHIISHNKCIKNWRHIWELFYLWYKCLVILLIFVRIVITNSKFNLSFTQLMNKKLAPYLRCVIPTKSVSAFIILWYWDSYYLYLCIVITNFE